MILNVAIAVLIGGIAVEAQTGNTGSSGQLMSGVVKAVTASSLTIEHDSAEVVFVVNSSTRFSASGGRSNDLVLRPPRTLRDVLKPGEHVSVRFRQSGSALRALEVRVVPKP